MLVYAELSAEVWLLFIVTMFKNTRQILSYDIIWFFLVTIHSYSRIFTILRLFFFFRKKKYTVFGWNVLKLRLE